MDSCTISCSPLHLENAVFHLCTLKLNCVVNEMELKVNDYYTRNLVTLRSQQYISDVLEAFLRHRLDIACILDESDRLIGIVSKYALYRALLQGADLQTPIFSIIRQDVVTLDVRDSLDKAKDTLLRNQVAHGVVVDPKDRVLGVMGKSDIIRGFLHETELLVNQLSSLVEHLQDAVITIDIETRITTFNRAAEQMFHIPKDSVIGMPVKTRFPQLYDRLAETLESRSSTKPCRIDMKETIVVASFIPISYNNGVSGAMAVLRDITTLESIARELETTKNLEHTLQHALALSYDGIIITDAKGFISVCNEAFLDLFNAEQEDLLGKPWSETVPDLALEAVLAGYPVEREIRTIRGKACVVIQEPIVRSNQVLGTITKIIFQQLDQWRNIFRHLEQLESELQYYRGEFHRVTRYATAFDRVISTDSQIEKLKQQALLAAQSTSTVLITGESGTGKELFAEAIHEESGRPGNFVKVNCAAIPAELLESEFFGYAEGAFTGARRGGKPGKFELADRGTLCLDEIGEMPLSLQAKLLRALQEQEFERVGDIQTRRVDVRIIAATNRDLKQMVRDGTFREDLYYRVNVVHLSILPLRKRIHDIPLLCEHLIKKLNKKMNKHIIGITPQTLSLLQDYTWPGNVRQLENILERAMNLGIDNWIEPDHLPDEIKYGSRNESSIPSPLPLPNEKVRPHRDSMEAWEKKCILDALEEARGSRSKAAKLLGISRSALYQKMRKYQIAEKSCFEIQKS